MKIVSFLSTLLVVFSAAAQHSYYFAAPLPSAKSQVDRVEENFMGTYATKDGTITYQFDVNGLTIISTTISTIRKETVRESSKYSVRDGYLFGVEKNDSVPCILKEGVYYFGVRNYDQYVGGDSKHLLTKMKNYGEYVLNVYEDGKYVPQLLKFSGKKLEISHFDYNGENPNEFDYITTQEVVPMEGLKLIVLKPTESELDRLIGQSFVEDMTLKR